jgi:hypothetical protein
LPYQHIEKMNFYVGAKDWWLEILPCEVEKSNLYVADLFPLNGLVQKKLYLKIDQKFFDERFEFLEKCLLLDTVERTSKAVKLYEECPLVHESLAMNNFLVNQKYSAQYSCEFTNLQFNWSLYQEYMEFNALHEFNKIKNKDFIPLTAFSKVYREADQDANMPLSKTADLIAKLLQGADQKTSVILVSGIPGSGKGRLSDFLSRQIQMENIPSTNFKMPTVQESVHYSTEKFIKAMINFKQTDEKAKRAQVIVATLPGYNHLKKVIFELKKSEEFGKVFDIKYVLTKVVAKDFYTSKNRNYF